MLCRGGLMPSSSASWRLSWNGGRRSVSSMVAETRRRASGRDMRMHSRVKTVQRLARALSYGLSIVSVAQYSCLGALWGLLGTHWGS